MAEQKLKWWEAHLAQSGVRERTDRMMAEIHLMAHEMTQNPATDTVPLKPPQWAIDELAKPGVKENLNAVFRDINRRVLRYRTMHYTRMRRGLNA